MSTGPINHISYSQSIFVSSVQSTGSTVNAGSIVDTSQIDTSSSPAQSDNSQLSPFAQLLSTLQQLQQSNPTQYQQVTHQISTNLQAAAQTAQAEGNTSAATQLSQLATDFSNASSSGQLPNIQDLAQATGSTQTAGAQAHHHHHHHGGSESNSSSSPSLGTSSTSSSNSSSSSSTLNQMLSSLLSAFQSKVSNVSQGDSLNPLTIISNTLSSDGITGS